MGSKADYRMDFDVEDRIGEVPVLRLGERIRGTATVIAGSDLRLNSLEVQLMWKAHGKGSSDEAIVDRLHPDDVQELRGGLTLKLPFDLAVPDDAPISYDGETVKVSWFVRTYLDIPWAIDDEESFPLLVMPRLQA